jgi:small nuclear ribonucleoprotein (snRNP)-like protein
MNHFKIKTYRITVTLKNGGVFEVDVRCLPEATNTILAGVVEKAEEEHSSKAVKVEIKEV